MAFDIGTINVRITIGGENVAFWRVRVLGWCARRLGVPVAIDTKYTERQAAT